MIAPVDPSIPQPATALLRGFRARARHRALLALRRGATRRGKRAVDIAVATALLIVAAPLLAAAVVAMRLSGRPALAPVMRRGRFCRPFSEQRFAVDGPAGRCLARLGLTRWPALVNVLRGDLSLVGPRPVAPDDLSPRDPRVRARYDVRPGLVCLWWVRRRMNIAYGSETEADVEYVATRSVHGDLGIAARALLAAAYGAGGAAAGPAGARLRLLGLELDNVTMDAAVARIAAWCDGGPTRSVSFVNPHCANLAQGDHDYRRALRASDLCLPDGIGIKVAGQLLGQPLRQNVNGTDLFPRLCAQLAATGDSLYLLGGRPGIAEGVADWVRQHAPGTCIAGVRHGYFTAAEEPEVLRDICQSGARVLLVAFGVPRQDVWIQQHAAETGVAVAIGVGGLFDFYSGRIPRAPQWLREVGLEWLYRFIQEPRRMWRRYFVGNFTFLARVVRQRYAGTEHPKETP